MPSALPPLSSACICWELPLSGIFASWLSACVALASGNSNDGAG
eukprot:CAMPEP_0204205092 /NCGR_PEP_ID=MMETSP0361-20130328/70095_1 /ASSEMBLY_ACC=CAM_ASM_000343 /TAXON_ID=268821 /ORGANISM="Scrippsiella Hangoei, Strain SHTV-5" /LENGTH=43 /DNA_ID= /DNA_START= /DNA_END= /DNA_ORIENTATION=